MTLEQILAGQVLSIDKPFGWTSFDVVKKIRSTLKKRHKVSKIKVGHAGTLDPLATGVLVICTGKATKSIESIVATQKEYTGTFYLGATTPSFDLETEVDCTCPTAHITPELLDQARLSFIGETDQEPPIFSAKKIAGKQAYKFARKGREVELSSVRIEITSFELTRIELPEVDFRIVCSKGTYIRAIARDFGLAVQSGAYLSSLCRTRVGDYHLADSQHVDKVCDNLYGRLKP